MAPIAVASTGTTPASAERLHLVTSVYHRRLRRVSRCRRSRGNTSPPLKIVASSLRRCWSLLPRGPSNPGGTAEVTHRPCDVTPAFGVASSKAAAMSARRRRVTRTATWKCPTTSPTRIAANACTATHGAELADCSMRSVRSVLTSNHRKQRWKRTPTPRRQPHPPPQHRRSTPHTPARCIQRLLPQHPGVAQPAICTSR